MEHSLRDKPLAKELSIYLIELKGEKQFASYSGLIFSYQLHSNVGYSFQLARDFVSRRIDCMSPLDYRFLISIKNPFWELSELEKKATQRIIKAAPSATVFPNKYNLPEAKHIIGENMFS